MTIVAVDIPSGPTILTACCWVLVFLWLLLELLLLYRADASVWACESHRDLGTRS
jgi:hypothetical protein